MRSLFWLPAPWLRLSINVQNNEEPEKKKKEVANSLRQSINVQNNEAKRGKRGDLWKGRGRAFDGPYFCFFMTLNKERIGLAFDSLLEYGY